MKGAKTCIAHADRKEKEARGFGGPQPGSGRPPNVTAAQLQRQIVEDHVAEIQRPYWRALGYDLEIGEDEIKLVRLDKGGAKVSATFEGRVLVSDVDDLGAQIAAAEKLQDRALGRPKQTTEVSGPDGGPIETQPFDLSALTDEELREYRRLTARAQRG